MKPWLGLAGLIAGIAGCGNNMYVLPPSAADALAAGTGGLEAAAIKVDITPPIGLSLAGHGLEGRIGVGVLTHLYCRGFVFRERTDALAWLACDTWAITLALHRRVAELVHARVPYLGTDRIVLSATHTHAGPAHIAEGRAYTTAVGGSRDPAYDQMVVDFMASRIADAIGEAAGRLVPATIGSVVARCLRGVSRNRAMPAYARNPESGAEPFCGHDEADLDDAHRAVNRDVTVLRVDATGPGRSRALGVMAVYAVHPTALPNTNELYGGDLLAFATRYCEDELALAAPGAVCALANGAEGDVSPDWSYQSEDEARRIGERLGEAVVSAFGKIAVGSDPPVIESRYRELILPGARVEAGAAPLAGDALCSVPQINTPAGGGAPDGPTRLRIFEQMNAGISHPGRMGCAASGVVLLGFVPSTADDGARGFSFPARVPVEWFRIGRQAFVGLPGEPTTVTGDRIARAAQEASVKPSSAGLTRVPVARTTVVGLTNAYVSYFATPQEYEAQHYEGASTVYGPATTPFFVARVRELATPGYVESRPCASRVQAVDPQRELAADPEPFHLVPSSAKRDPNLDLTDGRPCQPRIGEVGPVYFAPDEYVVRQRWPEGISPGDGCWDRFDGGARREPEPLGAVLGRSPLPPALGRPRWCAYGGKPALLFTWRDDETLRMCGASVASLLMSEAGEPYAVARSRRRSATPDRVLRADAAVRDGHVDAERATERWQYPPFEYTKEPAYPPIDDEHAMVAVAYDHEHAVWRARFRADLFTPGEPSRSRCFRFAIRGSKGQLGLSAETCAVPPSRMGELQACDADDSGEGDAAR
ncbi:neutral/alkaline non-lysosomal ceramidase N-terminal domain-containing protein [Sorangium sp. So ce388]|uniref:neutral/alkaline non-lysosomal ceramidase N-terminal domain-containing protein n=1 Tax=Sorangium sp. So ce388 TaxID=3133309 RepID=UPI003F5B2291